MTKLNNLTSKQKIILISVLFFLVIITLSIIFYIKSTSNIYGKSISIKNYDQYINDLPQDKRNSLDASLYEIIKNNLSNESVPIIDDALIRDGSVNNSYNSSTSIHSGSFIVDIKSIKQSYSMSYEWSSEVNNPNFSGYTAAAQCLSINKLIYGDFNCKDTILTNKNTTDPILDYLPYSTFNYTITANYVSNSTLELNAKITLYSYDTRNDNGVAAIARYKQEIVDWIKSKNLKPEDYLINYTIN